MITLEVAARRITQGDPAPQVIQECVESWLKNRSPAFFSASPPITNIPTVDVWMGGAAEMQAFLLQVRPPAWAMNEDRFFEEPVFMSDNTSQMHRELQETPSFFRKRLFFCGRTRIA